MSVQNFTPKVKLKNQQDARGRTIENLGEHSKECTIELSRAG